VLHSPTTAAKLCHAQTDLARRAAALGAAAGFVRERCAGLEGCCGAQLRLRRARCRGAAAQNAWVAHHAEIANATLVTKTDSWYMGSNVKGKPRRMLSYAGGVGTYRKLCDEVAAKGYQGFALA
jgi:hypothetical protein